MSSAYEQSNWPTIERATLAEDITFSEIKNISGKFFVQVLTPQADTSSTKDTKSNGIQSSNYITLTIPAYMLLNFMNPIIEKDYNASVSCNVSDAHNHNISQLSYSDRYILGFQTNEFTIPQGTNFLIEFLGGELEVEKINIIGIEL